MGGCRGGTLSGTGFAYGLGVWIRVRNGDVEVEEWFFR